jgi:hypothetical protein
MSGGLIQLVARGHQDLFLTHDPQITFFKMVYRRYTNFTIEEIQQNFLHPPDFGKRVSCILSRNGDLIRKIHLVIDLPSIPQFKDENQNCDVVAKFAWVRKIGYAIIKNVEIEIGGELIDRQYGDWLNIWQELFIPRRIDLNKMIGNIRELTDFTNGKRSYRLFIPLQFWFNRITGLALPIVGLQYNYIKLNLELNPFDKCYITTPTNTILLENAFVNFEPYEYLIQTTDGITSIAQFIHFDIIDRVLYIQRISEDSFICPHEGNSERVEKFLITGSRSGFQAIPRINAIERIYKNRTINFKNICLKHCFLLVEYGFLDDEERLRFARARHEYLIEQVFYNGEETIDGLHQSFKVGFTQPCKELIWVSQLTLAQELNETFNYTDNVVLSEHGHPIGKNIITHETILFNSQERLSYRDSQYYNWLQPYQYHRHGPREGINVYSFALHPEKHQPSGTANLTRIDNVDLKISVVPKINFKHTAKLRIYGIFYNILRIANGVSGVVFAVDNCGGN